MKTGISVICVICGWSTALASGAPIGRSSPVSLAPNSRATFNARLSFTIVNLPESFKGRAIRKSIFQTDRAFDVQDSKLQHITNRGVKPGDSFRRQLRGNRERADA